MDMKDVFAVYPATVFESHVEVYWKYILRVFVSTDFYLLEVDIFSGMASLIWT